MGNSFHWRPWRVHPASFLLTPPHCLKKNGILCFMQLSLIDVTQFSCIGRAPGPLSPPTITQLIFSNDKSLISVIIGSIDKYLICAGVFIK